MALTPYKGWNARLAHTLAFHSAACYLNRDQIFSHARAYGRRGLVHGDCWWAGALPDCIVLAFRGTQVLSLADWKTDFSANLIGSVHAGFSARLAGIRQDVLDGVDSLGALPVYITGHSLGAAIGTLAARELQSHRRCVAGVYLYGSPRVGGLRFAAEYRHLGLHKLTFRHRNQCDIVTRIPPHGWLGGFRHVGREIYYDADALPWFGVPLRYRLLDMLDGRVRDLFYPGTKGIKDHAIARYVKITRPKNAGTRKAAA